MLVMLMVGICVGDSMLSLTGHAIGQVDGESRLDQAALPQGPSESEGLSHLIPPPSAAAVRESLAKVKEIFHDEFAAATTPERRVGLAKQLLLQADKTQEKVDRWVLLNEVMRLASDGGDLELSFQGIQKCAAQFAVDADSLQLDALSKIALKAPPQALDELARTSLVLAQKTFDANKPPTAQKYLALANGFARKAKNRTLIAEIAKLQQAAKDAEKEAKDLAALETKLAVHPGDPEISLEVGKYLCFKADDWGRGLPLLAKGSDGDLSRLALAETLAGKNAPAIRLGDAWWDWATNQKGSTKSAGMAHAASLYGMGLANVQGLDRARLDKRIREARNELAGKELTGKEKRVAIADLGEESVSGMRFGFAKDGTFQGKKYTCCGQAWPKGVLAHAHPDGTSIIYNVPPRAKRLVGKAGIFTPPDLASPDMQPLEPQLFEILVDGHTVWKSAPLTNRDDTADFKVELYGASQIEFRTVSKDLRNSWSAWLNPEIVY